MEIIDNKCPSCGASLEYNIETQNWKCKHCRKEYELSEVKKIKHSSRKNINELVCPTCNAKLIVNDNIISTKCIYCRNDVIVEKTKDKIAIIANNSTKVKPLPFLKKYFLFFLTFLALFFLLLELLFIYTHLS